MSDQFFDLRGLSKYSSLAVSTLRGYVREGQLPCYRLKGKLLFRQSEFNKWIEKFRDVKSPDLSALVDETIRQIKR